jgi:hypothetical protein
MLVTNTNSSELGIVGVAASFTASRTRGPPKEALDPSSGPDGLVDARQQQASFARHARRRNNEGKIAFRQLPDCLSPSTGWCTQMSFSLVD